VLERLAPTGAKAPLTGASPRAQIVAVVREPRNIKGDRAGHRRKLTDLPTSYSGAADLVFS
jgi:hypothetical protein